MSNAEDTLKALCKEGKVITLKVRVTDTDKAIKLLGSMYNKEAEKAQGVEILSWGFYDLVQAHENRDKVVLGLSQKMMDVLNSGNLADFIVDTEKG